MCFLFSVSGRTEWKKARTRAFLVSVVSGLCHVEIIDFIDYLRSMDHKMYVTVARLARIMHAFTSATM